MIFVRPGLTGYPVYFRLGYSGFPAPPARTDGDRWSRLRDEGKEQEHGEDDEMHDALQHRRPSGPQRDHAHEERQGQQDLILLAKAEFERLTQHDRHDG